MMKFLALGLMLASVAVDVGATNADDCRKSLAMLDAAMQLEDVHLRPDEQLDTVVSECRATWPRYRGYINCAKTAKGHDDLIACIDLWQRRLRRLRKQRGAAVAGDDGEVRVVPVTGGVTRRHGGVPPVSGGLQLSLGVTPDGVCWYDNRLFSAGAVLLMPGDGHPYRCGRLHGDDIMAWLPGAKP